VLISESKLGYVYARDGSPLPPSQTLGRIVDSNHFQDARAFLEAEHIKRVQPVFDIVTGRKIRAWYFGRRQRARGIGETGVGSHEEIPAIGRRAGIA
jgi:hypothetical protein